MGEMVERVREAIERSWPAPDADFAARLAVSTILARAAIEAMREPSEAMLSAVSAADQQEPFSDRTMRGVYCGMIDAALAEP